MYLWRVVVLSVVPRLVSLRRERSVELVIIVWCRSSWSSGLILGVSVRLGNYTGVGGFEPVLALIDRSAGMDVKYLRVNDGIMCSHTLSELLGQAMEAEGSALSSPDRGGDVPQEDNVRHIEYRTRNSS